MKKNIGSYVAALHTRKTTVPDARYDSAVRELGARKLEALDGQILVGIHRDDEISLNTSNLSDLFRIITDAVADSKNPAKTMADIAEGLGEVFVDRKDGSIESLFARELRRYQEGLLKLERLRGPRESAAAVS